MNSLVGAYDVAGIWQKKVYWTTRTSKGNEEHQRVSPLQGCGVVCKRAIDYDDHMTQFAFCGANTRAVKWN